MKAAALQPRRVLGAVGVFVCTYAFLMAPWPGLDQAFTDFFCGVVNVSGFERRLESGLSVRLRPTQEWELAGHRVTLWHAFLEVEGFAGGVRTPLAYNTRLACYVPFATLVALSLAVHVGRRLPASALVLACLLLGAYVATGLLLVTVRFLALPGVNGVMIAGSARALLEAFYRAAFVPPGMTYAVPALILAFACWIQRRKATVQGRSIRGSRRVTNRRQKVAR